MPGAEDRGKEKRTRPAAGPIIAARGRRKGCAASIREVEFHSGKIRNSSYLSQTAQVVAAGMTKLLDSIPNLLRLFGERGDLTGRGR